MFYLVMLIFIIYFLTYWDAIKKNKIENRGGKEKWKKIGESKGRKEERDEGELKKD